MTRRTLIVPITAAGRDRGKRFLLTEMAADQAERWATRAILAFANSTIELPKFDPETGSAGLDLTWRSVLVLGLNSFRGVSFREVEPLLEEMRPMMQYLPPGNAPAQEIHPGENSQIEEVTTWYTLRYELLQLHLGFSMAVDGKTTDTTPSQSPA